jgi:cardiolipin synthase
MAKAMEQIYVTDLGNCSQLTADDWFARPVHKKAAELFLGPLRPLL